MVSGFALVVWCWWFVCVFGDDSFNGSVLDFMNGLNATSLHDFIYLFIYFILFCVWLMKKLRKRNMEKLSVYLLLG